MRQKQNQRNQHLSDEELQRTQVLNLKDFKETARIERLSSKKPAIIVAAIGLLSISCGLAFPTVQTLSSRQKAEKSKEIIEQRKKEEIKPVEETIKCNLQRPNLPNGVDETLDVTFVFKDNKLHTSTKKYTLVSTNKEIESPDVAYYLTALQSYLMQTSGYSVSVETIEHGSITTTEVNYLLLGPTTVPELHQENYRFNVLHTADSSKEDVKTSMTEIGYTCEEEK